jgi:Ribonuclease G/E
MAAELQHQLLIAAGPGEWRAALVENGVVVELLVERGEGVEAGSIYLGRVARLLPALGASLVDIGGDRPGFLPDREIVPRGRRLDEGERTVVQVRREAQGGKAARLTMRIAPPAAAAVEALAAGRDPPARLHPAASFAAALAGAAPGADEILADDMAVIPEIRAAFPDAAVALAAEEEWPVDLGALFDQALSPVVPLDSGGSVHIDTTPAAVLIDVDSGTPASGSAERTALQVNLAAAAVIAREIRRRNLGGGIVVDFVGLDSAPLRRRVQAALAAALAADPARPQILGWTGLGHLELVRPRRRRSLSEALLDPEAGVPRKSALTVAFEALRTLRRASRAAPGRKWRLIVAAEIAAAFTGAAAGALDALEKRFGQKIAIEAEPARSRERFDIVPL